MFKHVTKETHILIVDDNPTDRLLLKGILKSLGHNNIQEAEDGGAAVSKIDNAILTRNGFHLVFLDIQMPKKGGLSALEAIRTHSKTQSLYVIMMTAAADPQNLQNSLKVGIDDFIVKPFNAETIDKKMSVFLSKKGF